MRILTTFGLAAAATLAATLCASAASSAWHDSEGGRIRLVTSGQPDAAGRLEGVLEVALKPGWKTYWRDPGDSGVPPQLDVSASTNISQAALSFPAPRRHEDGYGGWAGYDHPVSLPVVFTLATPGSPAVIYANVFLGMCETICIPVQASLKLDPSSAPDDAGDTALVQAGFSALPAEAKADFGAKALPGSHETLVVEATAPGKASAVDLFVAGENGYMFGPPSREESDGRITFRIPVLDRPAAPPAGAGLPYTLTGETGAVQGLLPYP
ncbi:MAG: protein-disulfide reductase DsbD domain-containing protein [Mesorhizobium sp.]